MATVYLALGSNLGDRLKFIQNAIEALPIKNIQVEKISSIRETDPVGGPAQGKFLNAVLKTQTTLSPEKVLVATSSIEKQLGRKRSVLNAPRTIDIDILLYDNLSINSPTLTIPHSRMMERAFVLDPLKEIAPKVVENLKRKSL